jgi:hypothetical protein
MSLCLGLTSSILKLQKNVTKEKLKIANLTNLTSNAIKAGDDGFRKYFVNYQTLKKIHKGITNPSDEYLRLRI